MKKSTKVVGYFDGAGNREGIELWRIENFVPVRVQKVDGRFCKGDSYILLQTSKNINRQLQWNIHFWLGSESSQDESGTAAILTAELDDKLGGKPIQYREVEGLESALFLSYFALTGVEYVQGGFETGFHHVVRDNWPTRLLQVSGKRTVRLQEVPLALSSLNKSDSFILDAGFDIYVFYGENSTRSEKLKAVQVARSIDDIDRGARATVLRIEEDPKNEKFWSYFGGYVDPSTLPEKDSAEEPKGLNPDRPLRCFQIVGDTMNEISQTGKLSQDLLHSDSIYFLEARMKAYVWVGKTAPLASSRTCLQVAATYTKANNFPPPLQSAQKNVEGKESAEFKLLFFHWKNPVAAVAAPSRRLSGAEVLLRKIQEDDPLDDGSGDLKIWVVVNFDLVPLDPSKYGQFHGGDSYVVQYIYSKNSQDHRIVFYWLGLQSSLDETGTAALKAKELDDQMGGHATQVRVVQGKEPIHFRQIFKGRLIIHDGGHASGFHNVAERDSFDKDGHALFHVKGTNSLNVYGNHVAEEAKNLNSADSFVLVTPSFVYNWSGNFANEHEKDAAENIAKILKETFDAKGTRQLVNIAEGSEPDDFWVALGGKAAYASLARTDEPPKDARLFQASNATGKFDVQEVFNFTQDDLTLDDVFLLDTYHYVYLWIGTNANEAERRVSRDFAVEYVHDAATIDHRDPNIPIITCTPNNEPHMFYSNFIEWVPGYFDKKTYIDPYQKRLDEMNAKKAALAPPAAPAAAATANPPKPPVVVSGTYSYDDLKNNRIPGIDPAHKEKYLSDEEFLKVFKVNKTQFNAFPAWKEQAEKKKVGLF